MHTPHGTCRTGLGLIRPLLAAVLASSALAASATEATDAVQARLDSALDRALSTAEQLEAIAVAQRAWDQRLNHLYRELQQQLPQEAALALRESQRAWLRFRDAEHAALTTWYATADGSLYRTMHALDHARLLQHRVAELEGWKTALEMDAE